MAGRALAKSIGDKGKVYVSNVKPGVSTTGLGPGAPAYYEIGLPTGLYAGLRPEFFRRAVERIGGRLPVNPHGGQLSHGRTHGMGLMHEAITQLRGEAGERQVADARVGVVSSGGLTPSGVLLLRTDR